MSVSDTSLDSDKPATIIHCVCVRKTIGVVQSGEQFRIDSLQHVF